MGGGSFLIFSLLFGCSIVVLVLKYLVFMVFCFAFHILYLSRGVFFFCCGVAVDDKYMEVVFFGLSRLSMYRIYFSIVGLDFRFTGSN